MEVPTPKLPSKNSKHIEKHQPRPYCKEDIYMGREIVGYIQMVEYFRKGSIPHLEYHLEPDYRGKGIMSKELPKYLKYRKKWGDNRMLAIVDTNNAASKRLLEANGFIYVTNIGGKESYIIDLTYDKKDIEFATNVAAWHSEKNRIMRERYGRK